MAELIAMPQMAGVFIKDGDGKNVSSPRKANQQLQINAEQPMNYHGDIHVKCMCNSARNCRGHPCEPSLCSKNIKQSC